MVTILPMIPLVGAVAVAVEGPALPLSVTPDDLSASLRIALIASSHFSTRLASFGDKRFAELYALNASVYFNDE